jgi:cytochrome c-type biogenesis protein CcmH/NrfG
MIGEDALRHNDFAGSIAYLEKATQGLPGNADGWALLGRAYHANRRFDDAAEAYKKAVEAAPQNVGFRATYGLILGQAGDLDGGLAQLQKVTATPGYKDAAGWVNLGWIYRNMNKPDESIAAYKKGLELDPKQEQAALGLGWAYSYTKNYDAAIKAYQQAIQIDSKEASGDANVGIAWAYFFKRELPEAKQYADKAAAAGRNVEQLKEQIAKYEKALAAGQIMSEEALQAAREQQQKDSERQAQLDRANNAARSAKASVRAGATRQLAALAGGDAVPTLVYLMQTDPDYDVRIAATNAIGSLGGAARSALKNVEGMLRQPPYEPPINATPQEMENSMKDADYRRALRDALAKIK